MEDGICHVVNLQRRSESVEVADSRSVHSEGVDFAVLCSDRKAAGTKDLHLKASSFHDYDGLETERGKQACCSGKSLPVAVEPVRLPNHPNSRLGCGRAKSHSDLSAAS